MRKLSFAICFFMLGCTLICAQVPDAVKTFRKLTVANGLPQSFVSSIVQDSTGFMWIATRDGLARYDGRKFKIFLHKRGDPSSLANNIISELFLDKQKRLWILYETGDIDVLNTVSEQLTHLSADPVFKQLVGVVKKGHSVAEDATGNIWLISEKGGVFIGNLSERRLKYYSDTALGLTNNRIVGITARQNQMVLLTDRGIVVLDARLKRVQTIPYSFRDPGLYNDTDWKDVRAFFRKNGQIVIQDGMRMIVYEPGTKKFSIIPLPNEKNVLRISSVMDSDGRLFVVCNNTVYILTLDNKLQPWLVNATDAIFGFKSVFIDRSGLLWLGGNGTGVQVYDLYPPGFSQNVYEENFHTDICSKYFNIPDRELESYRLNGKSSYAFRWLYDGERRCWFTMALESLTEKPELYYYSKGHLVAQQWHNAQNGKTCNVIGAMALSPSGKLWGIDIMLRPVHFDTSLRSFTAFDPIGLADNRNGYTVSGLLMDGESRFWASTATSGLFFYDLSTRSSRHYTVSEDASALPTNQLMNMVQDPSDSSLLWIGSIGGGLIRFNKANGRCRTYTIDDGLPNNTVYAVMMDASGLLWCSSNKGIFSFDRITGKVQSFTSEDGLPCDEFNRYHYLRLPDGRLAFGGIEGYTVFDPLKLKKDFFQPRVAITAISINNVPVDYGTRAALFDRSVNSLDTITLNYDQNFVSFEVAALQYNVPEKLQYRYRLEGYDGDWVYAGSNNIITYTKLPPGEYLLKINATNTAGQWSRYVKTITLIIRPPFWQRAWFILLVIAVVTGLIYRIIKFRINLVRNEEQQKASFEKEAAELKAQALRAQMNPHFIFNCLNSIKSLIQSDSKKLAVLYLTTFSRLIRNQLNNAQHQVSLHAELETCKLYTQLESLRFGSNIFCIYQIDEGIDLYSVMVPPLVLQPFIENAIWHGILPKNGGEIVISVYEQDNCVFCTVDDNGVGRELSLRNKSELTTNHESKGMKLVSSRLNLYNSVNKNKHYAVQIVDKKDAEGNAAGTLVIIKFQTEL